MTSRQEEKDARSLARINSEKARAKRIRRNRRRALPANLFAGSLISLGGIFFLIWITALLAIWVAIIALVGDLVGIWDVVPWL